jgi:hypothetical protein
MRTPFGLAVIQGLPRGATRVPPLGVCAPEHDLLRNLRPPVQPGRAYMAPHVFIRASRPDLQGDFHPLRALSSNSLFHSALERPSVCSWPKATPRESPWEPFRERFGRWFGRPFRTRFARRFWRARSGPLAGPPADARAGRLLPRFAV